MTYSVPTQSCPYACVVHCIIASALLTSFDSIFTLTLQNRTLHVQAPVISSGMDTMQSLRDAPSRIILRNPTALLRDIHSVPCRLWNLHRLFRYQFEQNAGGRSQNTFFVALCASLLCDQGCKEKYFLALEYISVYFLYC